VATAAVDLERRPGAAAAARPTVMPPEPADLAPVIALPERLVALPTPQRAGALAGLQRGHGNAAVARLLGAPVLARAGERCQCGGVIGPDGQCDKCRAERQSGAEGDQAIARMLAGAAAARLQRLEKGSGLDDPLYMEDREWSSGQGPDDRVTGQRLRNWAIARGSMVVHSEGALKKMQVEDGAEPSIVEQIYALLVDLLRGADVGRTTHILLDGDQSPYPVAEGERSSRLDKFKGSPNAREMAVLELSDSWGPVERYLTHALSRRFNTELLDAYGRTPKRDMEVETKAADILALRKRGYADVWIGGYAPFGGTNAWSVGDRVGRWKVAGIKEASSLFWAVLDGHPLWYYRANLNLLGTQDVFVQKVAAGVADQAKFAGMLWPMMIKTAGFALSFSPAPVMVIAGGVIEAFGEEGIRDLTGEGRSFKDVSGETARQILIDLALNKLFAGGGKGPHAGTEAAVALERAVEATASRTRTAVKEAVEKSEGAQVEAAVTAGRGRRVADDKLRAEGFVDEVHIKHDGGEHTFRRKGDGTWCRWSVIRLCDLELPNADRALGPPRTGRISSDVSPKAKAGESVYDLKKASTNAADQSEVRMAQLWEQNGHEVHWNANDAYGDFKIDGVATDSKLLVQSGSIAGAVKRANSQGSQVIIDGTVVKLTRQDTERLIRDFQAVRAKHPGPYRNVETIYIVEGDGTIYILRSDTKLKMDPDTAKGPLTPAID
jgi:hypothetical protein